MGILKKVLWDASPAVIIGKKMKALSDAKPKEQKQSEQPKQKKEKRVSIGGTYYSSHPDVHGYPFLNLEFGQDGVYIVAKKDPVKTFAWSEIISFDKKIEDKSQISTNQRLTATRMATVGVFALAAPKKTKSGNIQYDYQYVLHTTTGDIEIESTIKSGDAPGSIGEFSRNMTQLAINQQTAKANNIRRLVAERATGKALPVNQPQFSSVADELERFAELKEKGVITQAEFDAKKKNILNS